MQLAHNWADWEETKRSYDLIARQGHGKDKIVVIGVHLVDIAADCFPERTQTRNRVGVASRHRHQQAPPVVEEFGET